MLTRRASRVRGALTITLIPLFLLLNSCAVFFNHLNQGIPVSTEPIGVEVYLNGDFIGITPLELWVSRGQTHELQLRFGEQEKTLLLEPSVASSGGFGLALDAIPATIAISFVATNPCSGWLCFNAAIAGIGLGASTLLLSVDTATGAIYTLNPTEVFESFDVVEP